MILDKNKWENILKKAEKDFAFQENLIRDTRSVCKSEGLEIPEWVGIKIEKNSSKLAAVITIGPLTDAQLRKASGGGRGTNPYPGYGG